MDKNFLLYINILLLLAVACQPTPKEPEALTPTRITIIDSLKHPWSMAFLTEEEVIVSEKDGNLLRVKLDTKEKFTIQGFPSDLVDSIRVKDGRDNSGIFEVVCHPDFRENSLVYVSYAAEGVGGSTTQVIRARLENDSLKEVSVILAAQPYSKDLFHYGGGMTFGSDGKLYVTVGERYYNEIDQPVLPVAQDVMDRRGKIYRLHPDGSIPEDNPDFGEEAV
ncbi:MAG: PQQ-dependent sugar dehydrogenase, partial [Bacteroidota bacterium]